MAATTHQRYHYDPSFGAAIAFVVLFALSGLGHVFQMIRSKTWYMIPFCVGVIFEVGGYAARGVNAKQTPNWAKGPYIAQTLLLLLAPALFAASIYMILGRIIRLVQAEKLSPIRTNWLTKIFVVGDVLSFVVQTAGGTIIANADSKPDLDKGRDIVLAGLGIQIIFFGVFMTAISVFHFRIVRQPTDASVEIPVPWKRYIFVLYAASILIMVRSVFRVAEFAAGPTSALQSVEVYLYCFDALLMFICVFLFNIQHPSIVVQAKKDIDNQDFECSSA